ncbi:phage holin family protein [Piscinibacter sp.]|uniref:phage holin family protein n=1 Tax=Piscinibacter sp. TaxID=1903157 RepID=UPI00355AB0BD
MATTPDPPSSGLLGSARGLLASLLEMGETRLQLASTELEEERLRVAELLVYAAFALFFLGVGLVLAALLLVLWVDEAHRTLALAVVTAVYLCVGAAAAVAWRRKANSKPRFLGATIDELRRDRTALRHAAQPRGE